MSIKFIKLHNLKFYFHNLKNNKPLSEIALFIFCNARREF